MGPKSVTYHSKPNLHQGHCMEQRRQDLLTLSQNWEALYKDNTLDCELSGPHSRLVHLSVFSVAATCHQAHRGRVR